MQGGGGCAKGKSTHFRRTSLCVTPPPPPPRGSGIILLPPHTFCGPFAEHIRFALRRRGGRRVLLLYESTISGSIPLPRAHGALAQWKRVRLLISRLPVRARRALPPCWCTGNIPLSHGGARGSTPLQGKTQQPFFLERWSIGVRRLPYEQESAVRLRGVLPWPRGPKTHLRKQVSAAGARRAHNPKVSGSIPLLAFSLPPLPVAWRGRAAVNRPEEIRLLPGRHGRAGLKRRGPLV